MDVSTLHAALRAGKDLASGPGLQNPDLWLEPNSSGNTALHLAARHGRLSLVPGELLRPEPFSRKNKAGYTPLHHAFEAERPPTDLPPGLLMHDMLAQMSNAGFSVYHIAAAQGRLLCVHRRKVG